MFARGTGKAVVAVAVVSKVAQRHFLEEKLLGETNWGKPFGGNHPRIPHFPHLTKLTRIMVTFQALLQRWIKTRIKRALEG